MDRLLAAARPRRDRVVPGDTAQDALRNIRPPPRPPLLGPRGRVTGFANWPMSLLVETARSWPLSRRPKGPATAETIRAELAFSSYFARFLSYPLFIVALSNAWA